MRDGSSKRLLPLAMLAALAGCGGEDAAGPGASRQYDWAAAMARGNWDAGHASFYHGEPVGALSEVRLVDRSPQLDLGCADLFDARYASGEFNYLRLRLPNLEAGTYPIVASGEDLVFSGAQLRVIRVWNGLPVPEIEAVAGTVTITPGESPERVTVAIDASLAIGMLIGPHPSDGVTTYDCQDGDSRETFKCDSPECCYGEKRIPFAVTLESAYCPEFCDATTREVEQAYCSRGH